MTLTESVHLSYRTRLAPCDILKVFKSSHVNTLKVFTPRTKYNNPHSEGYYILCAGEDLNLHALRHLLLRQACLPFHHPRICLKVKFFNSCASSRDRTYDLVLKRDLLYQLSYGRNNYYCLLSKITKKRQEINLKYFFLLNKKDWGF